MRSAKEYTVQLAIGLICAFGNRAIAADYYINPTGDDKSTAHDASHPWKTAAQVNSTRFAAGDTIHFERGGDWHEQLIASSGGTPEQPITYTDYGDPKLPNPTFWGSDIIPPASFIPTGNSTYAVALSVLPTHTAYYIFADHEFLHVASAPSNLPANSFFIDGSTIFINTGGTDPANGKIIFTASDRAAGTAADSSLICSNGHNNLVFKNLTGRETAAGVTSSGDVPDAYIFRIQNSSNVKLDHCQAYNGGKHHFGVINSTGFVGTSLHAVGCLPGLSYGHAGAFVCFSDASRHGDTSQWIDCSVDHFDPAQQSFITHGPGLGKLLIQNLISEGCGVGIGTDNPDEIVIIKSGHITGPTCDIYGHNILIDGLKISGDAKIDLFGDNNTVQNCIDDNSTNNQGGIICRGKGNIIRSCTLSHNGGDVACIIVKNTAERTQIIHNHFIGNSRAISDEGSPGSTLSPNDFDNAKN